MSRGIPLWSALLIIVGTLTAYAFVTNARKVRQPITKMAQDPIPTNPRSPDKIHAGALWPQLRWYLKAFGDRLERSGKERVTLVGTFDRLAERPGTFAAISEFPDRLQLTVQLGAQTRTITYDGQTARVSGGDLSEADQELIESLVNDTAEHFFRTQTQGAPTRHLGDRFRSDDGTSPNYEGPFHDVFSLEDRIKIGSVTHSRPKLYYFNSETRLLERVKYQISRNGHFVDVETQISGWQQIQDQQVARRIVRLEDDQQVMSLTITAASVGPRLNDGIF